MTIDGIDHLYIATRDFDRALEFWQGLGFAVTTSWGDDEHRGVHLESGGARLVLAEDEPTGVTVHFATDDLDAFSLMIEGQGGGTVETPAQATHWGTRWMRVRDPEGAVFSVEETSHDAAVASEDDPAAG